MSTQPASIPSISPVDQSMWQLENWPLGAHFDPETQLTTFAVYAPKATRVQLEIFNAQFNELACFSQALSKDDAGIWRAQLAGLAPGAYYGYRLWGENWHYDPDWLPGSTVGFLSDRDSAGNHFNPNKLLIDPYANEISHVPLSPKILAYDVERTIFGTGGQLWRGRELRSIDTARYASKSILIHDQSDFGERPGRPAEDAAIYEAHVKNLTMHPSAMKFGDLLAGEPDFAGLENIPEELRGTYAGAAYLAPYLAGLGMTCIEFLPVHETDSDQVGPSCGTTNHWGYQTLGFFAPNRDYAFDKSPGGPTKEFKAMVKAFHDAGIEVYLDVVFNHTAEGGNWYNDVDSAGFTCFGGFATTDYYDLAPNGFIMDGATGSANQTNFSKRVTCDLVLDSLRYWHDQMGVDGFRFDLATVLGRFPSQSDPNDWGGRKRFFNSHPLLLEVAELAKENSFEVIAEAWDLWGYEVGNFPAGWGEWNGRFRDAMRHYLKGDGNAGSFMDLFNGDWLHFNDNGGPQKSINFVTAHDGFTMFDLVSFNQKDNLQPYPFGPSDGGSDNNLSWDSGGDQALRRARWRCFWLVTFLARGVPMIVSGDEYGRSQNGNNNPWNLNTVGIWNNWLQAVSHDPSNVPVDPTNRETAHYYQIFGQCGPDPKINPLFRFAQYVTRLRRCDPTFRQRSWGDFDPHSKNVEYWYYRPDFAGSPANQDRALAVSLNGSQIGGTDYLILVNMYTQPQQFKLPASSSDEPGQTQWCRLIDTAPWAEPYFNFWQPKQATLISDEYQVQPWSIVVLAGKRDDSPIFQLPKIS